MNGERGDAAILQLLGKVHDVLAGVVPAQARLHRDGDIDGTHHGTRDVEQQRDVAQHACAGTLACHLFHRAAKVDVDDLGGSLLRDARRLDHGVHVATIDLDGSRTLTRIDVQLAHRAADAPHQRLGAHKLGVDHVGTLLAAYQAKRRIGDVLHGSEHHRTSAQVDVSYFHAAKLRKGFCFSWLLMPRHLVCHLFFAKTNGQSTHLKK